MFGASICKCVKSIFVCIFCIEDLLAVWKDVQVLSGCLNCNFNFFHDYFVLVTFCSYSSEWECIQSDEGEVYYVEICKTIIRLDAFILSINTKNNCTKCILDFKWWHFYNIILGISGLGWVRFLTGKYWIYKKLHTIGMFWLLWVTLTELIGCCHIFLLVQKILSTPFLFLLTR